MPSTALRLLTSTRPPRPQTSRSTAPANRSNRSNRSIRFTSLRFHSAPSVSAVQRKRTLIGAALRFAPFAQTTRPPSHDPHPQRLPFAAGCGRATMLALFPPLLITNPTHTTPQALLSASLRLRSLTRPHPDHQAPTDHTQMQCRVQPCTCSPQPDHQSHVQTAQQRPPIAPIAPLHYAFIPLRRSALFSGKELA